MKDSPNKKRDLMRIYDKDELTPLERLQTVIRLQEPDRVPLSFMLYYFAPLHAGVKMSRYMTDPATYMEVMRNIWKELGPWDIYYNINPYSRLIYSLVLMMKTLWPGLELEENEIAKFDEIAYMTSGDYDQILRIPRFLADFIFRRNMLRRFCQEAVNQGTIRLTVNLLTNMYSQLRFWKKDFKWWRQQGAVVQSGYQAEMPFDTLSQARTVINFSLDLVRHPGKIKKAAEHLSYSFATQAITFAKRTGVPVVQCYCHRTSNDFISPQQFEELVLPGMEIVVNRIVEAGMTPILHCDGDWLRNLKSMRKLPAKKIILQLDGHTDIFRAKEEIGDCMCIFGDVPAAMLAAGSPNEVEEYCHRLIEEIGKGGGFILASGCEVPPNAKMDNLKAMVRAVKKYGYLKRHKNPVQEN